MEKKKGRSDIINRKTAYTILGILGALIFSTVFPTEDLLPADRVIYSNSIHSLLFAVFSAFFFVEIEKRRQEDRRRDLLAYLLALLFALFLVVGSSLESLDNFNLAKPANYVKILGCSFYFAPVISFLWQSLSEKTSQKGSGVSHKIRNALFLFLCWMPVFLAFYPGAFVYDAWEEYVQAETGEYTTHHPLSHVLLLGKMILLAKNTLGSYNLGIAAYTLLQMLLLALILSHTIEYLRKKGIGRGMETGILLFYGFFPIVPMYAVCSAKDTLFSGFLLLTIVSFLEVTEAGFAKHDKKSIFFVVSALLMMLFRNNGSYAYGVWMIAAAVCFAFLQAKQERNLKQLLCQAALLLIPLFLFFLVTAGLEKITAAEKGGKQEIMTVPIQQMARVYQYAPETYSEEEKQVLYEILPKEELHLYTPRISDLLKSKFDNDAFRKEPSKYLALWLKTGLKKPFIYLNAWWLTSYGYWYPDSVINVYGGTQRYSFQYEDSSYFGFETEPPGERSSKLPALESFYRKISLELYQQKLPTVSMLFSPGFLFWCFSFFMGYYLWKKEGRVLLAFGLLLMVWLTVIPGPTYLVRYVLILWFAAPLFVSLSFCKR